jgi:hypothetical protein
MAMRTSRSGSRQVVGGKGKDDAEGQFVFAATGERLGAQAVGVADAGLPETFREGDGVPVKIKDEAGAHVGLRASEPELGGPEHGRGCRGGIEFAEEHFVAHGGPADFTAQADAQAVVGKKSEFLRDREWGGVG